MAKHSASPYLGDLEEVLGDVNDTLHLLDGGNSVLDGLGVVVSGRVQDVSDLVDLSLGPLGVHWSSILSDGGEDGEQAESNDGFLVDDQELVGDGGNTQTSTSGQSSDLGDQAVAGDGVDNGLGLNLWVWDVGVEAGLLSSNGDGRKDGWAGEDGTSSERACSGSGPTVSLQFRSLP